MRKVDLTSGVAALALLMGGCTDDGAPATTAPSSSNSSFDKAAAGAAAKSPLLQIGDFPADWASTPPNPDSTAARVGKRFSDCVKAPTNLFGDSPDSASENSPDFYSPDENTVVSANAAIAAPGKMQQFFDLIKGDKVSQCMAQVLDDLLRSQVEDDTKGVKFDRPRVGQPRFPSYGDETVPLRVSMSASYPGQSFAFYFDVIYVRVGDNGVSVLFEGADSPVPIEMEQKYVRLAADRLKALPLA